MLRHFTVLLLSGTIMVVASMSYAETMSIHLLLSGDSTPYRQFSATLKSNLVGNNPGVTIVEPHANGEDAGDPDLVIAVGIKAVELALGESKAPILSIMVPKNSLDILLERFSYKQSPKNISAIYLDQPWERQLDFISAALPRHNVVGVLYSPDTPIHLPRLPRNMSLNARSVRSPKILFDALESILSSSDVLLVIPDSEIYSSSNVRNILLTSYRYKVPLIGISQAYVNAGALGAVFSTPEQLAEQTVQTIISFVRMRHLPQPQYPTQFSIALNPQIARSLGITLDAPEVIRERMNKAGEGRQ